jgi:effector-binding domain-containing protein
MIQSVLNFLWSVAFAIASTFGVNMNTEQPRYEVVERIGDSIEIRQYATRTVAETTVETSKSDNPRGDAFRIVAGYIFGANKVRRKIDMTSPVEINSLGKQIAMTTPVEVGAASDALVMRFFMPAKYSKNELPEPTDPRVKLLELPPKTMAVLRFSGSTADSAVNARTVELIKALESTKWKVSGPATAFFYNPPWTIPFLRTNEVVVSVSK